MMKHQPVLFAEVIAQLAIKPDGIYVDATFGRGGHARAILAQLGPSGRLLAIDRDPEAVAAAAVDPVFQDPRFVIRQGSFAMLAEFVRQQGVEGKVDGILFDLGVSSPQLDDPKRGFSFQQDSPLDMRMDPTSGVSAAEWLNKVDETELANVLYEYGEERFSRRIARRIVEARQAAPITTTKQLVEIIIAAQPHRERHKHPATRSFQAIRIFINQELTALRVALDQAVAVLAKGGRLLVISFHSLEDRIVKQFMRRMSHGLDEWAKLPVLPPDFITPLRVLGKAVKPGPAELATNPRARSAILRVAEKIV
ncbi:MAG: 16S rRNA (cytosine(1402)-N(4))-methyltransferase RsmH [Coxiellaceae bacterium]|nr:MAG: 16S rRNA (cytosine(1402)-N(4))-methyltransferase RsmH [Coxiellaceae bacterium]